MLGTYQQRALRCQVDNRNGRLCYDWHVLRRVGFFDFADECSDPVALLEQELSCQNKPNLQGTLLVLPEALNLGRPYYGPKEPATIGPSVPADEVLVRPKIHAVEYKMVFVAGLLKEGYCEAYWVDPEHTPELMCRKAGEDGSENYRGGSVDVGHNPINRYGACVGAFICLDSLDCKEERPAARARRRAVIKKIGQSEDLHRIMCIPSYMSSHCDPRMDGMWCILASRGPHPSVVKDRLRVAMQSATSGHCQRTRRYDFSSCSEKSRSHGGHQ